MKRTTLIIVFAMLISSCASVRNKPISSVDISALSGKAVIFTHRNKADFTATTAGKAAFGILGALSAISAGDKIVTENGIADPSNKMGEDLAKKLQEKYGSKLITSAVKATDENIDQIIKNTNEADYLIDIKTTWWGFGYLPFDWSHYNVAYWAEVKLIDLRTKTVIAEGGCRGNPGYKKEEFPTFVKMLESEAAVLKAMINASVKMCQKEIEMNVFKL